MGKNLKYDFCYTYCWLRTNALGQWLRKELFQIILKEELIKLISKM